MMSKRKQVFEDQINTIETLHQDYMNNPFSADIVHDLRVAMRKFRALLNFVKPQMDEEDYERMNGTLRDAAMVFGPLRELDVLTEYCEQYAVDHPQASEEYYQLFNTFAKNRRLEMNRTFNKTNQQKIRDAIDSSRDILEMDLFDKKKTWKKFVVKRIDKKASKLKKAYKKVDLSHYEEVHEIRKQAKKQRYSASFFNSTVGKDLKQYEVKAKDIQNEFGEITDAHVNYDMLTDYADKVTQDELRDLILTIRDDIQFEE